MWSDEPSRLALLELWANGTLHRRQAQAEAWDDLKRLPWTRRTPRRDELALDPLFRPELETLLGRAWPGWREVARQLDELGLSHDERGYRQLCDLIRQGQLPASLPERLNQRTATAAVAPHSKATLSAQNLETLGRIDLTHDGVVRLRPNPGLRFERGALSADASELATLLGEVSVAERAFRDGTRLGGRRPEALLLVENKGTFVDLTPPSDWLVAHVPGWDTATARDLLAQLTDVPVVHFGDLDPNGVRIVRHLCGLRPDLLWAIPPFWAEHVPTRALQRSWPDDLDLTDEPQLVRDLAMKGLWLEQELLALDSRLTTTLRNLVQQRVAGDPIDRD